MEKSSFFNSIGGDRRYLAQDWAAYFSPIINNGINISPSNALEVTPGSGLSVNIRPGFAWINGFFYENNTNLVLALPAAHGTQNRINRIVIRLDLTERRIFARVSSSVFAIHPTAPELQRDANAWEICLADVWVNAGATTITPSNITDQRRDPFLCGEGGVAQSATPETIVPINFTIPTTAWVATATFAGFGFQATIQVPGFVSGDLIRADFNMQSVIVATAAGVGGAGTTATGSATFFARSVPTAALAGSYTIFKVVR